MWLDLGPRNRAADQPGPELAQHGKVEPFIIELQAQGDFQSASRTASAACRSVRFSVNCSTVIIASCAGEIPGAPRVPYVTLNASMAPMDRSGRSN